MEVGALLSLRTLAAVGTITRTAQERGFTPSAVSQQVKRLERQVGVRLVVPAGRGVLLTPAGQALVAAADDIVRALERGEAAARGVADGPPAGVVRVAAFSTALRGIVAPALPALAQRFPLLRVEATELDPDPAVQAVAHGAAEVAVVHDADGLAPVLPAGLEQRHVLTDVGDVVLRADHPLVGGARWLTAARLDGAAWVTSPPGTVCHQWFQRLLAGRPGAPDVRHVVDDFATQLALVANDGVVALVPRLARPAVPAGLVVMAVRPRPVREVAVVWRSAAGGSPAVRVVVEALGRASG